MKDLLKKQRIKRRFNLKKLLLAGGIVSLILLGGRTLLQDRDEDYPLWQVTVRSLDDATVPLQVMEFVIATVREHLRDGGLEHLEAAVALMRENSQLATANIIRTSRQQVTVFVEVRRPLMVTLVNRKLRYLSIKGDIYGQSQKNSGYPRLSGVLLNAKTYKTDTNDAYILTADEQRILHQAISLLSIARQNNLAVKKIIYENYRGFKMKISNLDALIFFGHSPFAKKFQKLQNILASLQKKNTQATRIELDYEGKAFVKEKKI